LNKRSSLNEKKKSYIILFIKL